MSSIAHSIMETTGVLQETGIDNHNFTLLDQRKSIHSDTLFSEGDEVYIQHRGEQYLLRRTRNGKLILTK
jgi:hemin uptake protein HemP